MDRFDQTLYIQTNRAVTTYKALSNMADAGLGLFSLVKLSNLICGK